MQIQDRLKNPKTAEKLVTLYGVSWAQFKNIEANLTNVRAMNLTYVYARSFALSIERENELIQVLRTLEVIRQNILEIEP
jgi:hypothetical protein